MSDGPYRPGDTITKDPDAVLPYLFDWSEWLEDDEAITSQSVAVDGTSDGLLTIGSVSRVNDDTGVLVPLSGGTVGKDYRLRCRIVTDASPARTDDRSVIISARQR